MFSPCGYRPDSDVEFTHGLFVNMLYMCKLEWGFLNLSQNFFPVYSGDDLLHYISIFITFFDMLPS